MSSVSHRPTVDKIIAENGKGNPPVVEIIEYRNIFDGGLTWKLVYKGDNINYIRRSLACLDQRTIWRRRK